MPTVSNFFGGGVTTSVPERTLPISKQNHGSPDALDDEREPPVTDPRTPPEAPWGRQDPLAPPTPPDRQEAPEPPVAVSEPPGRAPAPPRPAPVPIGAVQYLPVTGTGALVRWTGDLTEPQSDWLERHKATRIDHLRTAWLKSRPPQGTVMLGAVVGAPTLRRWATLTGVAATQFGITPGVIPKGSKGLPGGRWRRPAKLVIWVSEDGWVLSAQDVPEGMGDERIERYVFDLTGQHVRIPDGPLPWGEWAVER